MTNESGPMRRSTIDEIMELASSLRRQADDKLHKAMRLEALARQLQTIKRYAGEQSRNGGDGGPYIGEGSEADHVLWEMTLAAWKEF